MVLFPLNVLAADISFSIGTGGVRFSKKEVKSVKEIREQNVVRQRVEIGCGPASLATILTYYFKDKTSEQEIIQYLLEINHRDELQNKGGFSLLDLKKYAQSKNYQAAGYRMKPKYLKDLDKPAIVLLKLKRNPHFMVLKGVRGNRAFLADPAWGNITMSLSDFSRYWEGSLLIVSNEENETSNLLAIGSDDVIAPNPDEIRRILASGLVHFVANPSEF